MLRTGEELLGDAVVSAGLRLGVEHLVDALDPHCVSVCDRLLHGPRFLERATLLFDAGEMVVQHLYGVDAPHGKA